jgi:hypothetical protein
MKIEKVVDVLNDALRRDGGAINALLSARIPCNESLADHPTIVVGGSDIAPNIGVLGLINGVIEPLTGDRVCAHYSECSESKLVKFSAYNAALRK